MRNWILPLCGAALGVTAVVILTTLGAPSAHAQPRSETLAVRNARLYPVTAPVIASGTLVVTDGKIAAVGANVPIPPGARIIDANGKSVMPGIVESHSHMGMKRLWIPADLDNNELSGPINAQTRAIDSIDTTDRAFRIALTAGVTTMNITNGSQTPNGGQAEVDRGGRVLPLLEVNPIPEDHGAIEGETWLGAVPRDELPNRVVVGALAAGGRQAVQYRRLGVFKVRERQDPLGLLLLAGF